MRTNPRGVVAGCLAVVALGLSLATAGSSTAGAATESLSSQQAPADAHEAPDVTHGPTHSEHDDGMTDAEMLNVDDDAETSSGHDTGEPVLAAPDEAGRRVVVAGFAAINFLVLGAAGVLRRRGHGPRRRGGTRGRTARSGPATRIGEDLR
jgi:hypothetical protein